MTGTWYLGLDGTTWEDKCHALLHIKHEHEYQEISDLGGDGGLDGLVARQGIAYQAYGLTKNNLKPTESIKNKISQDLKKLRTYREKISDILGDTQLNCWILLINRNIPNSSLHAFAKEKESEVRGWKLEFISTDFTVIIKTPSYLESENLFLEKQKEDKIDYRISPRPSSSLEEIRQDPLFIKVFEKFMKISPSKEAAEKFSYEHVKDYFENAEQLQTIQEKNPEHYEEIEDIRASVEREAEEGSMFEGNYRAYKDTIHTLETRLNEKMGPRLSFSTLSRVRIYTIADWLIRCPLNFKVRPQDD